MTAEEARKILGKSNKHFDEVLDSIYKEVKSQAEKGLNWANGNLPSLSSEEFVARIKDELVLRGYETDRSGANMISVKW